MPNTEIQCPNCGSFAISPSVTGSFYLISEMFSSTDRLNSTTPSGFKRFDLVESARYAVRAGTHLMEGHPLVSIAPAQEM